MHASGHSLHAVCSLNVAIYCMQSLTAFSNWTYAVANCMHQLSLCQFPQNVDPGLAERCMLSRVHLFFKDFLKIFLRVRRLPNVFSVFFVVWKWEFPGSSRVPRLESYFRQAVIEKNPNFFLVNAFCKAHFIRVLKWIWIWSDRID
jgi:hypothetical protein